MPTNPQPRFRLFQRVIHSGSSEAGTTTNAGTIYGVMHSPKNYTPGFWYFIRYDNGIDDEAHEANLTALEGIES